MIFFQVNIKDFFGNGDNDIDATNKKLLETNFFRMGLFKKRAMFKTSNTRVKLRVFSLKFYKQKIGSDVVEILAYL